MSGPQTPSANPSRKHKAPSEQESPAKRRRLSEDDASNDQHQPRTSRSSRSNASRAHRSSNTRAPWPRPPPCLSAPKTPCRRVPAVRHASIPELSSDLVLQPAPAAAPQHAPPPAERTQDELLQDFLRRQAKVRTARRPRLAPVQNSTNARAQPLPEVYPPADDANDYNNLEEARFAPIPPPPRTGRPGVPPIAVPPPRTPVGAVGGSNRVLVPPFTQRNMDPVTPPHQTGSKRRRDPEEESEEQFSTKRPRGLLSPPVRFLS